MFNDIEILFVIIKFNSLILVYFFNNVRVDLKYFFYNLFLNYVSIIVI